MKEIASSTLDVILPRTCPGCSVKLLPTEKILCVDCLNDLTPAHESNITEEFTKHFEETKLITGLFSMFLFEKGEAIQKLLFSIKYERRFSSAFYMGELLGEALLQYRAEWEYDLILPVPLHKVRLIERGFNQANYIAKGISSIVGVKSSKDILYRKRYTDTQTKKDKEERKKNVQDAFKIKSAIEIENKNILLVDDVITTGSTINAAAGVLKLHGASSVFAASIALA
ncbi:MAG: ComF family protein [Ignavibacteria bacterium]|nr:ComF family protein [Ignavibacteria bacterium]